MKRGRDLGEGQALENIMNVMEFHNIKQIRNPDLFITNLINKKSCKTYPLNVVILHILVHRGAKKTIQKITFPPF